jgi:DNA anti-recombination protein RmuC
MARIEGELRHAVRARAFAQGEIARLPLKRATDSAARGTGAIERFIERTLAPRLEELSGEVRGLRGELGQIDKRLTESIDSLRNETVARIEALEARINGRADETVARIDTLEARLNGRIDTMSERASAFERHVEERFAALDLRLDERLAAIDRRLDDKLSGLDEKIASTNKRFDQALDIRERLAALEAKVEAQKRNGA